MGADPGVERDVGGPVQVVKSVGRVAVAGRALGQRVASPARLGQGVASPGGIEGGHVAGHRHAAQVHVVRVRAAAAAERVPDLAVHLQRTHGHTITATSQPNTHTGYTN